MLVGFCACFLQTNAQGLLQLKGFFLQRSFLPALMVGQIRFLKLFLMSKNAKNAKFLLSLKKEDGNTFQVIQTRPLLWEISCESYPQVVEHCSCLLMGIRLLSSDQPPGHQRPDALPRQVQRRRHQGPLGPLGRRGGKGHTREDSHVPVPFGGDGEVSLNVDKNAQKSMLLSQTKESMECVQSAKDLPLSYFT